MKNNIIEIKQENAVPSIEIPKISDISIVENEEKFKTTLASLLNTLSKVENAWDIFVEDKLNVLKTIRNELLTKINNEIATAKEMAVQYNQETGAKLKGIAIREVTGYKFNEKELPKTITVGESVIELFKTTTKLDLTTAKKFADYLPESAVTKTKTVSVAIEKARLV